MEPRWTRKNGWTSPFFVGDQGRKRGQGPSISLSNRLYLNEAKFADEFRGKRAKNGKKLGFSRGERKRQREYVRSIPVKRFAFPFA